MIKRYMLFFTPMCPKCPNIKEFMEGTGLEKDWLDAATPDGLEKARELGISGVPLVIFFDENGKEVSRAGSIEEVKRITENKQLEG